MADNTGPTSLLRTCSKDRVMHLTSHLALCRLPPPSLPPSLGVFSERKTNFEQSLSGTIMKVTHLRVFQVFLLIFLSHFEIKDS